MGAAGPVLDAARWLGGCGRKRGRYVTARDMADMPTVKYPGVEAFFAESSLSPSQFCSAKTSDAQPRYLLRVKMAAIGSVDEMVEPKSPGSLALLAGAWYGTTRSGRRMSFFAVDILWSEVADRGDEVSRS